MRMRTIPFFATAVAALLATPLALADSFEGSASGDCQLFGSTACHLEANICI
jgi:hypothetical protein